MIVRNRPSFLSLFFILRGSAILRILPQILIVAIMSALIVWGHEDWPALIISFSGAPYALLGIALSVFLGFRNNACYDRWWEARRAWGQLISASRVLAVQTLILDDIGDDGRRARRRILNLTIAFTQALVCHLRDGEDESKVASRLEPAEMAVFETAIDPPGALLSLISRELAQLRSKALISDFIFQMFDETVSQLGAAQVVCERISNTPLPFGYTLLLHRTAYLFCFLLPFGFVDTLGWGSPLISALVAYTFFGLDALGDELEDPFGKHSNALAIGAMADTIEISLRHALGETDLPPPPQARNYLLM